MMASSMLFLLIGFFLGFGFAFGNNFGDGMLPDADATHFPAPSFHLVSGHGLVDHFQSDNTRTTSTSKVGIPHETIGRGQQSEREHEPCPYVFGRHSFTRQMKSEAGEITALPNFLERSHGTLKSLEDYEVGFLIMEPSSLMLPHYVDADWFFYVAQGNGRISWVEANNLQERDLKTGDLFGLPGGTVFYLLNTDHHQCLRIFNLLHTGLSSNPGRHQSYYVAGGQNPSTVYSGFSWSTLQAAFNWKNREQLMHLLGEQRRGPIVYLKKEQLEKMNNDYSSRRWKWGWGSSSTEEQPKPFNLLNKKPDFSNSNGWMTQAGGHEYSLLKRPGILVSLWSLKAGSMIAPHWNSHSAKIAVVIEGKGTVEISCPQMSDSSNELEPQKGSAFSYEKVQKALKVGDVYMMPAGFPSSQIASSTERLGIVCFDIDTRYNRRYFLAGSNSVLSHMNKEIMEISYGAPWKEISPMLNAQKDEVILKGLAHSEYDQEDVQLDEE